MDIIIFIIILLVLVTVHELGHFITAKWFGIRVDEFGFGFPPRAMKLFKRGETEYTLNWLPIGGFVKIFGEEISAESIEGPEANRSFVNKPKWQQAIVLVAGIVANILLAWVLFSVGFASGMPTAVDSVSNPKLLQDKNLVIVTVMPDSPADQAKLISGDKILSLSAGGEKVSDLNPVTLREFIVSHEEKITLEYKRQEAILSTEIVPVTSTADGKPSIGISMAEIGTLKLPFGKALIEGAKFTWTVTEGTVVGLYGIVHSAVTGAGGVKDAITGPVGMVRIVGDASKFGFAYLLSFAALISVNLAVINLVPFPALDGGRLLFVLIEKIKGSRINPNFANIANMIGFWLLILLMVFVTYNDIAKLI